MTAIEICRTAALGGHVERCEDCAHTRIAYNSCRNRHCPKCQWSAAQAWLEAREAELLPVPYFHVVFTLPAAIGAIAYQNKAKVYGLLFKAAAETLTTIAADPKHLGAEIGVTAVLHTWGQNLDHHPACPLHRAGRRHLARRRALGSMPAGLLPAGARALAPVPASVPAKVSQQLARRRRAAVLHRSRRAQRRAAPSEPISLPCARPNGWSTPSARSPVRSRFSPISRATPIASPSATAACSISTTTARQLSLEGLSRERPHKSKVMTLAVGEFMRRFLLHVLPDGFHRIRHYGLFANGHRANKLELCRRRLNVPSAPTDTAKNDDNGSADSNYEPPPCPCCGGRMRIIKTFDGPRSRPYHVRRLDAL